MPVTQKRSDVIPEKLDKFERIYSVNVQSGEVEKFLDKVSAVSVKDMEYTPYLRFLVACEFEKIVKIKDILLSIFNEHETGAVLINFNHYDSAEDVYIKLSTAILHLLGVPDTDPLSGKYYATFSVKHTDDQLPALLRPYELFRLHTDGAYLEKVSDWIFFMKMAEMSAVGGQTRLLHIDDWGDFDHFYNHPINKRMVEFLRSPGSNTSCTRYFSGGEGGRIYSSLLSIKDNCKSVRFVDRFIHPKNLEEAGFIYDMQNALENSGYICEIDIPVGCILMLNNHHGCQAQSSLCRGFYAFMH